MDETYKNTFNITPKKATLIILYTHKTQTLCRQRLAARGQEAVNTEASATKADHEMSQIKNSKFHSH